MENVTLSNSQIIDLIDLPESLLEDLKSVQSSTYVPAQNQVLTNIVNKIVYQKVEGFGWENPFKKLDGRPIPFGDTIENIYVECPAGYTFDKDNTDPFVKYVPSVKSLYASINYERQYCVTIQDSLIRRAVMSEYGLNDLILEILRQLTTAKNIEEYEATIAMLNNPELYGNSTGVTGSKQFEVLNVGDMTDVEGAKAITQKIVDIFTSFQLPSKSHNVAGVLNASNKDDLLLIIKRNIYNSINLDFLTGVFNLEKVDLLSKIIVVESFQVQGVDGEGTTSTDGADIGFIILDKKCFDNHVALQDSGMIYNPKGKYTNHFMNLWKIISFKYFHNASAVVVNNTPSNSNEGTNENAGE
jgi:hypothetical protein